MSFLSMLKIEYVNLNEKHYQQIPQLDRTSSSRWPGPNSRSRAGVTDMGATEDLAELCFNSGKAEVHVDQLRALQSQGADFVKAEKNGWGAHYLLCRYDFKLNVDKLQCFRDGGVVDWTQVGGQKEMPEKVEFEHLVEIWKFVKG